PYLVLPLGTNTSREIHPGNLLVEEAVVSAVLESVAELDFTGFYAGGTVVHAYADSCGQKHWFATDSFTLDYSIFNSEGQAVKGIFAGSDWHQQAYIQKIQEAKKQLELLDRPIKQLPRGQYKTYFAPAAVADLLMMLSWGGTSEADLQQGNSALAALSLGEKQ
ncbi:Zn-dependent protease, partial [Fischerella thermalis WC542]